LLRQLTHLPFAPRPRPADLSDLSDSPEIRSACQTLASTTWDNSIFPGGSIKFDKTGQATNSYVMTQNLPGGKTILIWPKDQATGTAIVPVPTK